MIQRTVVTCERCELVQYRAVNGACRRCGVLLDGAARFANALPALSAPGTPPAAVPHSLPSTAAQSRPFALVLQVGRRARGLSPRQVADRSGLSFQQIYRIERDGHDPHYDTVRQLARALGVRPSFLARMTSVMAQIQKREVSMR